MRVHSTPFSMQKAGNQPDENEDALNPTTERTYEGSRLAFAVSDGATEAMLSARWAALLVKLYRRRWLSPDAAGEWLALGYHDWSRLREDYLRRREAEGKPVQWYEEPGLQAGAFATLLGITLRAGEQESAINLQAVAFGDSCLFQVREDKLALQFPFVQSASFNNRPLLISSNSAHNATFAANLRVLDGDARPGDWLYLMTDAISGWFMREYEAGHCPWQVLNGFQAGPDNPAFAEWVSSLRQSGQMKNDDVTLLRLEVM